MPMKDPAHSGRSVRSACLEPLGLSVTAGAKVLGVTRQTLNKIVNGSTEETWLGMQVAYDLSLPTGTPPPPKAAA